VLLAPNCRASAPSLGYKLSVRRARIAVRLLVLVLAACAGIVSATPRAGAHTFTPALLEIIESADGTATVRWKTAAVRPVGTSLEPILPERCRRATERRTAESGDGIVESWVVSCGAEGLVGATIAVRDLDAARTDALVRIALADGRTLQSVLRPDDPQITVPERASRLDVFRSYVRLGIDHILGGLDHLLFVLGLLLIARGRRSLLATVTAFTIGHSVTLSLAVLGVADVSSAATELLIALSVLALAVEVARGPTDPPTLIRAQPWLVAFAFGLLHGLGFAGALREVGLPEGEIPLALLSFNVGIEVGQIAFVLVVEAVWITSLWIARQAHRRVPARIGWIPGYVMGSLAAYWCFERAAVLFR
jgi:hydrogenase/urease accessory protein HupE